MKEKVLVFGSSGMLGTYLSNMLEEQGYEVLRNDKSNGGIDITNREEVRNTIFSLSPKYVVNCAAYTDVNKAESDRDLAFKVNADAPKYMAESCSHSQISFIHISTDYVFGENKEEGYREDYKNFKPLNVYGESKLEGELKVLEADENAYIFRTSWLFGPNGNNFIEKITTLAKEHPALKVVTDEVGCPTYVKDLSEGILLSLQGKILPGIYHICSEDSVSRNEYAKEILKIQGIEIPVNDCKLEDFERAAKVPNHSVLINTKLEEHRSYREMLKEYFSEKE